MRDLEKRNAAAAPTIPPSVEPRILPVGASTISQRALALGRVLLGMMFVRCCFTRRSVSSSQRRDGLLAVQAGFNVGSSLLHSRES